jgi:hypothetical protein
MSARHTRFIAQLPIGFISPPPVQLPKALFIAGAPIANPPLQPTVDTAFISEAAQRSEFVPVSAPVSPLRASAGGGEPSTPASIAGCVPPHATRERVTASDATKRVENMNIDLLLESRTLSTSDAGGALRLAVSRRRARKVLRYPRAVQASFTGGFIDEDRTSEASNDRRLR